MAFNKAPTALFAGYTSDGTNITIPIANLNGLTAAEANATTGDWRSIILAMVATAYDHYAGLATADKPVAFVAHAPTQYPVTAGDLAGTFKATYSFDFFNVYCTPNVADEPA